MTRKILTAFFVLGMTVFCYAQEKNEVRVYGGIVGSDLMSIPLDGAGSSENETSMEFGLKYLRNISKDFSIEIGISRFSTEVEIALPYFPDAVKTSRNERLKLIRIPLCANYSFWKYFFVNAGFLLSFDNSKGTIDSQSGIGYGIGLGGKYTINRFVFYLNPNVKRHAAFLPFKREKYHEKLTELGLEFGIGYRF